MKKEATYNEQTHQGVYAHRIHHGELLEESKVKNDAPAAYGQNLAGDKGNSGALKSLRDRYQKSS